jgi:hypothetical protein
MFSSQTKSDPTTGALHTSQSGPSLIGAELTAHPARTTGFIAIGAALLTGVGVYSSNERERADAMHASPIALQAIPELMSAIEQRRSDTELAASLKSSIEAAKSNGTAYPAGDVMRLEALSHKLSDPAPSPMVKIEATAVLDLVTHQAQGSKAATENPVYRYQLYDHDGKATNYTLSCSTPLSTGSSPVQVTFAADLGRMRVERDKFVVMPAPFPGTFSFPGTGEAILSFTVENQERAPSRLPR